MRLMYDNDLDGGTLTASTADPNFTISAVQDTSVQVPWKTTALTAQTVVVDLSAAATVSCIAIAGHNFTASATVQIAGNSSDSWGAPAVTYTVTYQSAIMLRFFTAASYRYWRFYFDDQTNSNSYLQVGRLFLGEYLQVDPSSLLEFPEERTRTDTVQYSIGNQMYADQGIESVIYRYQFPRSDDTMKGNMETAWTTVGRHKPIFFTNFDTAYTVIPPVYCHIAEDITFQYLGNAEWEYGLVLKEVD